MNWLRGIHDKRLKVKWDDVYKDMFRFRNGPFGFEITEILFRPDWLGVRLDSDLGSDSDSNSSSSSSSSISSTERSERISEASVTSETRERLAVAHKELTALNELLTMGLFYCCCFNLKKK